MARGTFKISIGGTELATYDDVVAPDASGGGPIIQTEALFRAPTITHFERGNSSFSFRAVIYKEQPTNKAAWDAFFAVHTWNGKKDVVVTHLDHAGAETVYTMAAAAATVSCSPPVGVTNIFTLAVHSPTVSKSP